MNIQSQRPVAVATAVLSLGLLSAGGGVAWATGVLGGVPDSAGIIHACYTTTPSFKRVLLIDPSTGTTCPGGFSPLNFNQTGPQGAQGAQGPQGVQGAQGSTGIDGATGSQGPAGTNGANGLNGASGLSGYEVVTVITPDMAAGASTRATCPSGKHALGGGGEVTAEAVAGDEAIVSSSAPTIGGVGWEVSIRSLFTAQQDDAVDHGNDFFTTATPFTVQVWATCATTS